ncbi:MAG: ATP-binding protein [Kiritimatiellae bacterium]|nr:ATP-binding protein [Kiritimatiellia bacterium]
MLNEETLNQLCLQGESICVDYKRAQYAFIHAEDEKKAELLKDVLCFANSFRKEPAYILIGVVEEPSGLGTVCGIQNDEVIDDSKLQEFINGKTNKPIPFSAYPLKTSSGKLLQVIEVDRCLGTRPYYLKKAYSRLGQNEVWIRTGTSSHIASPDEIAEMGKASFELGSIPMIKTSLVSENGEISSLISLCIISNVEKTCSPLPRIISGGSDYDHYLWIKENFAKLHFTLVSENTSRINAEDLEYKFDLVCRDGCVAWSETPAFATSPFYAAQAPHTPVLPRMKNLRPKEIDPCAADSYFEVLHDGEFSIEVMVYGKNIPEPIKSSFKCCVFVKEINVRPGVIQALNIVIRRVNDVLDCMKWWVQKTKESLPEAEMNHLAFEYAHQKALALKGDLSND